MSTTREIAPANDELEVSVFGPGRGECIVVHVPGGTWFVVDSLRVRGAGGSEAAAGVYLHDLLHVTAIYGVFLTHWHADHTDGAAQLLKTFAGNVAMIGLPPAFGARELASFVGEMVPGLTGVGRPVKDLWEVMELLKEPAFETVQLVGLQNGTHLEPAGSPWTLVALSPSVQDQRKQLATLAACTLGGGRTATSYDPNSGSAVLRLESAGRVVTLSSDLDVGEGPQHGWQHILAHHGPRLPSDLVKVGHHGSDTAYHEPAWRQMGTPDAVITPFPARGGGLPREKMLKRLSSHARRLYLTAPPRSAKNAGRVAVAHTPFSGYVKTSPSLLENVGQVRFRLGPRDTRARVELFSTAKQIAGATS